MLSILQELTSSNRTRPEKTRQQTIESAFSRVNARNASKDASTPPSLTTGTSVTDNSSEPAEESTKLEERIASPGQAGPSGLNHIKNAVNSKTVPSTRKNVPEGGSRTVSGDTLVDDRNGSQKRFLQEGFRALNKSFLLGAMPGDGLLPAKEASEAENRGSARTNMLDRASSVVEKTKSVLGKRVRETTEAGLSRIQSLKGDKRSSLRSREPKRPSLEGHQEKQARFLEETTKKVVTAEPVVRRKTPKKPTKQWLSQGLYVGQDRNWDARLTTIQNKKRNSTGVEDAKQRNSTMPLPMFAGHRILEMGRDFKLPFDVFSPLPPGQPKPDEWKKTQKNVFVGDAANIWKKAKPLEHSTCICTADTGCDENCFNRFMLYECDESNCNLGAACTNRSFAGLKERCKKGGKYNIGVEVLKTVDRGYGIRANRTFEPNQIIVEYTGEIITQEECDDRMHKRYKDAECYYLMDFDQSMILDATRGSIARFINHSCAPNCRMIKWTVQGKPRMALFAGDNGIMTGEELTYDYNFNPYSVKNVQECRCGAEECRGVLGPKPKEIREALKPIVGAGKRKFTKMVEGAVESIVGAAKRRKMNVPSSVKDALTKVKPEPKKPKVKPLPIGWVYPEEAQTFKRVNDVDPEAILRGKKRRAAAEGGREKKSRTISGTMLAEKKKGQDRRRSSAKLEDEEDRMKRRDSGVDRVEAIAAELLDEGPRLGT